MSVIGVRNLVRYSRGIADTLLARAVRQLEDLVADLAGHSHGPATTREAGFVPALSGDAATFLAGDGTWLAGGGGGGGVPTSRTITGVSPITGGGDLTVNRTLGFDQSVALDNNARVAVRKNSAGPVSTRRRLNLIEGSNVTLTVTDDGAAEEVDVIIAAASGGGSVSSAVVNVPSPTTEAEVTITDAGITALMLAVVTWGAVTDDDENSPAMDNVRFSAVCGAGVIAVTMSADSEIVGDFKLNYMAA